MLKLSAVVHTWKTITDEGVERFLHHYPYMGMLLCGMIMPVLILVAVGVVCCAVMLPVSLVMGWV